MRSPVSYLFARVSFVALVAAMSACSGANPGSPTAPSALQAGSLLEVAPAALPPAPVPPPAASNGASIAGSVTTSSTSTLSSLAPQAATVGLTVKVKGTSIEALVGSSGQFELQDVPEGNIELQFSGPGIDARIVIEGITAKERIELTIVLTGSTAVVDKENRETTDKRVNLSGKIAAVDLAALAFRVGDSVVRVGPTTLIRRGSEPVPLFDLRVGDEVKVKGIKTAAAIDAEKVEVPGYRSESGIVSDLAGSCPTLSFRLGGQKVSTDATTTYTGSSCGTVKNGEKRSASGIKSEGVLLARYVTPGEVVPAKEEKKEEQKEKKDDKKTSRYLKGVVAMLSGSCPSLTFYVTVAGTRRTTTTGKAITSSSTKFSPGACTDIKNGFTVEVEGLVGADGLVAATRVSITKTK